MATPNIRFRKGFERRFLFGHPWVYSNEVEPSHENQEIQDGETVALCSPKGEFLAYGSYHPQSLIRFREWSRSKDFHQETFFRKKISSAFELRQKLGKDQYSSRVFFADSDGISGLVMDRYFFRESKNEKWKKVLQIQTQHEGAKKIIEKNKSALLELFPEDVFVFRPDDPKKEESIIDFGCSSEFPLGEGEILLGNGLVLSTPFLQGQKTGFFLDQRDSIEFYFQSLSPWIKKNQKLKVLDVCSYVGQWGTTLAHTFPEQQFEIHCVDLSELALSKASENISLYSNAVCKTHQMDALKELKSMQEKDFDLVIIDPPALIPNRKSLKQGEEAYVRLNHQALEKSKPGGFAISCSCSQLFSESQMISSLSRASHRAKKQIKWIARSSQGLDHPFRSEVMEGFYLKSFLGYIESKED